MADGRYMNVFIGGIWIPRELYRMAEDNTL